MKITEPGIYTDFPISAYFADPCPMPSLSQSIAKALIDRSPAHARIAHPRLCPPDAEDEPEKYDPAKAIGDAAHKLMLGRGKEIAEGPYDDWRSKEAKAFKSAKLVEGSVVILSKHLARAVEMVAAAQTQFRALGLRNMFSGDTEVVLAWREGDSWFRQLLDWPQGTTMVWDYKTTGLSAAPHAIPTLMANAGWDVQAAMAERGLDVLDPGNAGRRRFRFIAQENDSPYALTVCELPESVMTMGRKKLAYAIESWASCMASAKWPAYPQSVLYPSYPEFRERQWLEREEAYHANLDAMTAPRGARLTSLMGG